MAGRGPVAALFAPLLPGGARLATLAIAGDAPPLFPDEQRAVARAVERRQRPFAFGRAAARAALGRQVEIGVGTAGQPIWPAGMIGSITHTDAHAVAVVGEPGPIRSIGIDLESLAHAARTPDLLETVATPAEREALAHVAPEHVAALVFSAKESVYKCLHPVLGVFLEFHDVALVVDGSTFGARATGCDVMVRGRFAIDDTHVATVAIC